MIDDHCHPFALDGGPLELEAVSVDAGTDADAVDRRMRLGPGRLFQELLTARLAERLSCSAEEVASARAEATKDYPTYVSTLFAEAGLDALVMDSASADDPEVARCAELAGVPVHPLFRIEAVVDDLMTQGASASDMVEAVERAMADAVAAGAVGFQTVLAHRTGLALDPEVTLTEANRSLESVADVRRRGKACRDLVTRRALVAAIDLERPLQVDVGFGGGDLRLAESNPLLLEDLLRTAEGAAAEVVFVGAGFPWHAEAAFLAASRPNVWTDVSLFNVFSPLVTAERLLAVLDIAPAGKVLLGTDGFGVPEVFWYSATVLREAWEEARARMAASGARPHWLERVQRMLFEDNARALYGL